MTGEAYRGLAATGEIASALGSAFLTLVEPHPGREREYNRWYEDDHYYSTGAMAIPWWIAGRRWVATRELRELRSPDRSPIADPVTAGCYLGTYWVAQAHWDDQWAWLGEAVGRLRDAGRMSDDRTHVHTAFYDYRQSVRRDAGSPDGIHALDYPFKGMVLETIDARGQLLDLEEWIVREHAPRVLGRAVASLCLVFSPRPWPEQGLWFAGAEVPADRLALLWFLEDDPRANWTAGFAGEQNSVANAGLGDVTFLAPFVPTYPGTDRYVDELR